MSSVKLFCSECLETMKAIPDKSVDCVICDLPYGTTYAKWDNVINFDLLWKEYERICRGAVVLFSSQPFTTKLVNSNINNYKYTWYWVKNIKGNYLNAKKQPLRQLEEISVFYKHDYNPQGLKELNKISTRGRAAETTNAGTYKNVWYQEKTGYPSNVLYFDLDKDKYHPTQKPVNLIEYIIKTYTKEGMTILDNCMGSGSAGVACVNTGRKFIGIELDEEYFGTAKDRIIKAGGKLEE
ncbi:MAG: DNA-methyltransferase [Sarcina sp.]